MALQRWGEKDMDALLRAMADWRTGNWLEQRAVVAALCEPKLLREPKHAKRVLQLLDKITTSVSKATDRKADDFKVLRQALGYGWSVAVAARPNEGRPLMEKWLAVDDRDARWIMRENLKKNRLAKMDAPWVESWNRRVAARH
jgi:hypothetical protein